MSGALKTSAAPQLAVREASFAYGARPVLHGVSLEVRPGELLALAGANGAGKTTLLHLLTGYLAPSAGSAELEGEAVAGMSRAKVASRISFVPQRTESVFPYRVLEVILMARPSVSALLPSDSPEDVRVCMAALEEVGLSEMAGRRFDELSGGERQLVLVARALAQETPFLVMDEPTTFLDLRRQQEVMRLLSRKRSGGTGIAASFHDLNLAARWADRLVLLCAGRVAACGTPDEVLREELLQQVYGLPLRVERSARGHLRVEPAD